MRRKLCGPHRVTWVVLQNLNSGDECRGHDRTSLDLREASLSRPSSLSVVQIRDDHHEDRTAQIPKPLSYTGVNSTAPFPTHKSLKEQCFSPRPQGTRSPMPQTERVGWRKPPSLKSRSVTGTSTRV
ncbi:hypothetical protein CEXT_463641 [Caerostris extrusa]|uniref:Uncharacterized protein n=1 Tax=Caerostris extrusa TaxID=172846 RepID=A0AAV4PXF3_CAEEX|nr:hypothetical protein CEXT_463641 [Caerostris extrusa]